MTLLVAVDDTDMPGTKGTGWLVQEMCELMEDKKIGSSSAISRHQLFVHPDVPFTSHNSSMCFELKLTEADRNTATAFMVDFLTKRSQPGSDPGLCIVAPKEHSNLSPLLDYGRRAKTEVLSKQIAYGLAEDMGLYLTEHGGTGDGVIGALAGIGLRLHGDDGRYRGWYHLGNKGGIIQVADILKTLPFVDAVVTETGETLSPDSNVSIGSEKIKAVRQNGQQVFIVKPEDSDLTSFRIITSQEAKAY